MSNTYKMSDPELVQELRRQLDSLRDHHKTLDQREIHLQKMMERIQVMIDNLEANKVSKEEFARLCGELEGKEEGAEKAHDWWKYAVGLGLTLIGVALSLQAYFTAVGT